MRPTYQFPCSDVCGYHGFSSKRRPLFPACWPRAVPRPLPVRAAFFYELGKASAESNACEPRVSRTKQCDVIEVFLRHQRQPRSGGFIEGGARELKSWHNLEIARNLSNKNRQLHL